MILSVYDQLEYEEYLEHNGVLGQRWGVQNGPPYPLSVERHSKSEIKAGYKRSLGGKKNPSLYNVKSKNVDKIGANGSKSDKKFELTEKQKTYIKRGAIAVGAALAVGGGIYLAKKYGLSVNLPLKTKALGINPNIWDVPLNDAPDFKDVFGDVGENAKQIVSKDSIISDTKEIAKYAGDSGMDCQTGALAQVLRWKTGEKFVPIAKATENYDDFSNRTQEIMHCFKGLLPQASDVDFDIISKNAALDGDNTFGFIMCRNNSRGHIMPYYVKDGDTIISSHQLITEGLSETGIYTKDLFKNLSDFSDKAYILRLDDLDWDLEAIKKLGIVG